jgi:mono/diheme cytochrome c family protein/pimeloyl-ACP methyl ester carboxylesterase
MHVNRWQIALIVIGMAGLMAAFQNCSGGFAPAMSMDNKLLSNGQSDDSQTAASWKAIVDQKCAACHQAGVTAPFDLLKAADLIAGRYIDPANPTSSILYQQVKSGTMPNVGDALTGAQVEIVRQWIAAQAAPGGGNATPTPTPGPGATPFPPGATPTPPKATPTPPGATPPPTGGANDPPIPVPGAAKGSWTNETSKEGMTFARLMPHGYDPKYKYPVILFLHQLQNDSQVPQQQDPWVNNVAFRQKYPAIIIAPRCTNSGEARNWGGVSPNSRVCGDQAINIVKDAMAQYSTDPKRIYVTGNSMGGLGTWDMIQRFPDLFAAGMPLAGNAYYFDVNTAAKQLKNFPIWSIHSSNDDQVPPGWDQQIYQLIQNSGGIMKFTETNTGHDCWDQTYPDLKYWDWLYQQKRQ